MTVQYFLPSQARLDGVMIGTLLALPAAAEPLVSFPGCADAQGVSARCLAALGAEDIGRPIALMFENGDPTRPLVLGRLLGVTAPAQAQVDNERLELRAEREIVLRCGKASITLTRAGKVIIQGAYLSSRSSGVNRIKGGSVQIN